MIKIMFVCTGNICRSAMAHHYMQHKVKKLNIENMFLISSCGIYAMTGSSATINSQKAMEKYQVNLNTHRATNISDIDIENYNLVLCMTKSHKEYIISNFSKLNGQVYTLKEYVDIADNMKDINDPWECGMGVYINCAGEIVKNVDNLIDILRM